MLVIVSCHFYQLLLLLLYKTLGEQNTHCRINIKSAVWKIGNL